MLSLRNAIPSIRQLARTYATATNGINEVVIVSAARTPVGCFNGSLRTMKAAQLGAVAVRAAIDRAGISPDQVEEIYVGNVLQANQGQSPARQVVIGAGCPVSTEATTINKVCASGMKAITLATQNLQLGIRGVMVAGGMESMSNTPYYVQRGLVYGHQELTDGIIKDGLWDGICAETTAANYKITREHQDAHAVESYRRSAEAWKNRLFDNEIAPVTIKGKKGDDVVSEDEEYKNVKFDKIPGLKPVFKKDGGFTAEDGSPNFYCIVWEHAGTVTAANSSTLNDGASALVLMTRQKANELGVKPLARVIAYADAACAPIDFPIAPSLAVPIALQRAGLEIKDISLFEFNEAFSVVAKANEQILGLDPAKVNIAGGAVSLGHPIGSSGSRIVVTLTHLLKSGQFGVAAICNGGGAATSIVVQREKKEKPQHPAHGRMAGLQ
ncbi:Thiolase, N-terminal domain-containing protein [Endogone sp. FLAS-F59071]|nr:Thiolase, N-terminal domain-containing protein [Endogone sp. FLAS-F59071]|eukprot:RUS16152.1 Thiolase, N-terminal domain-containing protein [Endogone sp. FLAS-F59071]